MGSRAFTASFGGTCACGCGERIRAGDACTYGEDGLVILADCAESSAPPAALSLGRVIAPCASCHLVHAGECF